MSDVATPVSLSPSADLALLSPRANWWVVIPFAALAAAIQSHVFWFLNYVHVFSAIMWTGIDIFMGFVLGPILRRVDLPVRQAIIRRLMPRMLFLMPTVSIVTTTAGWYLADWMGLFRLPYPEILWLWGTLAIVTLMTVQGLGILLPINLMVYFELGRDHPDGDRVRRLMNRYVRVVAAQAVLQFTIIFIMAKFATGA